MDALSDVLRVLRLSGAMFLDAKFTAPWCSVSHAESDHPPGTEHTLYFHVLTDGHCKARVLGGGDTAELRAGDVILFPHDSRHLLGSDLTLEPVLATSLIAPAASGGLAHISYGGDGEPTRFVCGYLACDRRLCRPLLDGLPAMVRVSFGDGAATAWVATLLRLGAQETSAPRPGGATVLAKLAELLFVEAVRRYIESLPEGQTGWLAGLRDRFVGKALALMHERPEHAWTIDELGARIGISRSALAQRFTELIGQPPMHYLTQWRLTIAAQRLRNERTALLKIAADIGYESEASFNRAFKRAFGITPAKWRREGAGALTDATTSSDSS